jgi:hypothetical protein
MALQIYDDNGALIPNILCPNGYNELITGAGSSTASDVINADKDCTVRIYGKADLYYEVGAAPTATTSSNPLGAYVGEIIKVPKGHKIAVLITGDFHIRELT